MLIYFYFFFLLSLIFFNSLYFLWTFWKTFRTGKNFPDSNATLLSRFFSLWPNPISVQSSQHTSSQAWPLPSSQGTWPSGDSVRLTSTVARPATPLSINHVCHCRLTSLYVPQWLLNRYLLSFWLIRVATVSSIYPLNIFTTKGITLPKLTYDPSLGFSHLLRLGRPASYDQ